MITIPLELQSEKALRAVMNAVDRLACLWHLDDRQLAVILGLDEVTVTALRNGAPVEPSADLAERISYLLGIYKALRTLFPSDERVARWVHAKNDAPIFNGRSALEHMLSGHVADLQAVRRYLDAQIHGP